MSVEFSIYRYQKYHALLRKQHVYVCAALWYIHIWVIPCQINTQNGHPLQILLKLGEHIPYPKG